MEHSDWIRTEPDPQDMNLRRELGAGETAVITLAMKTQADLVILDDLPARLVAQAQGLTITGTLGVLLAAQQAGFVSDLKDLFHALQDAGFRIPASLLEKYG
jgi:predicted nucleic acid-binding protein